MPTIDLIPDTALVAHLREQLERERARNAGLERGLDALSARVEALRDENAALRARLEARGRRERRERRG